MSKKNIDHLQHVKSSVVTNGSPKLPTQSQLVEGEIAVNYADGYETLSIKSSSGNIVSFSADNVRDKKVISVSRLPQIPVNKLSSVTVSADDINKLSGISSNIQDQLDSKAASTHTHNDADIRTSGFMSASDKQNLDELTKYQTMLSDFYGEGNDINMPVREMSVASLSDKLTLSYGKNDYSTGAGVAKSITISAATTSHAGVMSKDDKIKLDSLTGLTEQQQTMLNSIAEPSSAGIICALLASQNADSVNVTASLQNYNSKSCDKSSIGFTIQSASSSQAGVMSAEDKQNLDDVSTDKDQIVKRVIFNMSNNITGSPQNSLSHNILVQNNEVGFLFGSPLRAVFLANGINNIWNDREIKTIGVLLDASSSTSNGYMSSTQYTQLSNLYSSHGGKSYLQLSGGTVTGKLVCKGGFEISNGTCEIKGEGIDLYHATPFIDFHYNNSTLDYTSRIIETSSGVLDINGLRINKSTGQVSIAGAVFDQKFSVNGSIVVGDYQNATSTSNTAIYCAGGIIHNAEGVSNFTIASNGDAVFKGTVNARVVNQTSDARLKENVADITEDLDKVKDVDFKEFNFKSDESETKLYGVIAQELESVGLGNLVSEDDKGMKSVNYTALLCLKIKQMEETMKTMQEEINSLKLQLNK